MKKIALLFTMVIGFTITFSQSYFPLVDSSKKWSGMNCGIDPSVSFGPFDCETSFIRFSEDTTINNVTYLKVYKSDTLQQTWELQGYIRENIEEKKIYFMNLYGIEGLMYDFNIQVNDTVEVENTYYPGWLYPLICNNIDSILIGNEYRKRFYLIDDDIIIDTWIEGIGSEYGILQSTWFVFGATNDLLCYYENDSLIYIAPYNDCNISGTLGPFFITENIDTAYLNTYYEFQLEISNTTSNSIKYLAFGLPEDLILDTLTGIISGVPQYIYSYVQPIIVINYNHFTDVLLSKIVVVDPVLVNEQNERIKFSIFPNPAKEWFQVSGLPREMRRRSIFHRGSEFQVAGNKAFSIYNSQGIKVDKIIVPDGKETVTINVQNWPRGMYFVQLVVDGVAVGSKKIIKN
jgi:hypothetical protein